MKQFIKKIKTNLRPIVQMLGLIVALFIPNEINFTNWIVGHFAVSDIDLSNIKYYILLQGGDWGIGLFLMLFVCQRIKESNKTKIFNMGDAYHDYPYIWYFICAKILGYKSCSLKRVPIYMQFKLIINDTFIGTEDKDGYYVGTPDDYPKLENEQIDINKVNYDNIVEEVNLVLADTYPIKENQVPINKKELPTIVVSRDQNDVSRYYSPEFVKKINNEVRKLQSHVKTVNIYATTNPKHTLMIARSSFKMADRGNIKKLVVFQQEKEGIRKFGDKGMVIFNNM